ncbi:MAG: DUF2332 domain-containing protein [Nocardioidaceae bacterium]
MNLVDAFQTQAGACDRLGSPMYASLLSRIAEDVQAGGVSADLLAGHEDDPGPSALALRLVGSVHRLVLERRAGALAAFYPSVGGSWDDEGGWRAFERLLREQPDAVRERLDQVPQTNEVGRAAALYGGLLHLDGGLPVRLHEIGSSGGLNLRADRFGYLTEDGRRYGDPEADLVFAGAWRGRALDEGRRPQVVERVGSDVMPVDVATTEGRLTLTSYVWPDMTARHERLRKAFEVAARVPAEVRAQDAVTFTRALELVEGTTTVLWHSVMFQYLGRADQDAVHARIEELGAAATDTARFAHLRAEPMRRTPTADHEFLVALRAWPGGERRILATTVGHGIPTTWE